MVSDLVRFAKKSGIAVGPGRGSSAASLMAYLLRITEIDPMQYPMMFERFIDPQRSDLPDFDCDFEDERRHEIFEYARGKYGPEYVANIGTFTGYKGKNSLDDIARVYKVPKWAIDNIKTSLSKGRMDTQGTTKRSWIRSIHIQMLKTGRTISRTGICTPP